MCATKKDILRTYELVNLGVAKSYTKEVLADGLQNFFEHDPYYIINQLPENEEKLLSQLLCMKMNEYVAVPRNDERHLMMQKIHLVVWYLGGLTKDDEIMDAISDLREACVDIYNEIARSDAKKPKELLYSLFGEFELRKASLVEI